MIKELDNRLRQFIPDPTDFLEIVALVGNLHQVPVLAAEKPYAIEIDGQKVTPVFTNQEDLGQFQESQTSARQQNWVERMTLEVLEEVIGHQLSGIVFNVKRTGDMNNSTIFKSHELAHFLNYYTDLLNQLMSDKNVSASLQDRVYLVPAFIHENEDGTSDRFFPTMSTPNGESYVPIFSNIPSMAKWYQREEFGGRFKAAGGVILPWTLTDIKSPEIGENEISDSLGVVIDAFDDKQILIKWENIN